jgi:hypothetical protein
VSENPIDDLASKLFTPQMGAAFSVVTGAFLAARTNGCECSVCQQLRAAQDVMAGEGGGT